MKPRILSTARLSFPLACALAALLAAPSVHAADGTWSANSAGNWTDSARWTGGIIANGTGFTASLGNVISAARTITLAADRTIGNITALDTSHEYTISGANILTLDVASGAPVIDVVAGRFLYINSQIAGSDGLQKNNTGGLTFSGASTYTGTTTINAGRIQFTTQASLYNNIDTQWTETNINVKSGASLGLSVGGTGEFTTANITTLLTNLAVSSSATSGMNAGSTFVFNAAKATGGSFTIADVIADSTGASGGSRALNKVGTGTLVLSGANTYTGATTVSGGTLQIENTSASTSVSIGSGTTLSLAADTVFPSSTPLTIAAGTIASGRTASGPGLTHVLGNAQIGNGTNNFIAGPNVTSGTAAIQLGNVTNDNASVATPQLNPTTANLVITGSVTLGVINAGDANLTLGGTDSVNSIAGGIVNGNRVNGNLIKSGTSAWTLSGANTYNGTTAINAGTLTLDYSSQDNSKLSDTATLTLGAATLDLSGGNHTEVVLSTTLTANKASKVTRSSGIVTVLQMNAITPGAMASIDFGAANIATTDNTNTNGMLGTWATVGGSDWAINSTDAAAGPITAYTAYTDVLRQTAGTIADGATSNVRIIEGVGANAITLGAATTTINTLNQSISGGTSAAIIDPNGQTLLTNAILVGTSAGSLTIGNGVNNGTLASATAGGNLAFFNGSTNGLTINSTIADNTSASSLSKAGTGTLTLTADNTYSGATAVDGILQVGGAGSLGSGSHAGAITNDGTLQFSSSAMQTLSGVISGTGALTKDTSASTLILTGVNTYTGATTISAGTLQVGGAGTLGPSTAITNNATLQYSSSAAQTLSGVISGAGALIKDTSASSALTLSGANTFTGATTLSTGTLILGNLSALGGINPGVNATSGISMDIGTILRSSVSGVTVSAPITGTGSVTIGAPNNNAGQVFSELILNGAIGGTTDVNFDSFLNANTIQTVTLGAANTYSGNTTIGATSPGSASQVFVKLGINDALPTTTILSIQGGVGAGTGRGIGLNLFGFNQTLAGLMNTAAGSRVQQVVNSDASAAATLTINSSSPTTYSGNLGSNSPNFSLNTAAIPGSTNGNNFGLTKTGASTFTLSGTNTYTGVTNVNEGNLIITGLGVIANTATNTITIGNTGTLTMSRNDTWGSSATGAPVIPIVINAGGTMTTGGSSFTTLGQLTLNGGTLTTTGGANANFPSWALRGSVTVGGSVASTISGSGAFSEINLGANSVTGTTFDVADATGNASADLTVSAVLQNGRDASNVVQVSSLTKDGSGTMTLSGANTYTGNTLVNTGTLVLADNAQLTFVLGASSGTHNGLVTGTGTAVLDGDFFIDTTAADALASGTWTLVDNATLIESYTTNFTIVGFTDAGSDKWTKPNGPSKVYTFDETTGVLTLSSSGSYASWIAGFPGVGLLNGVNDDPDNDGIDNGTEMVLGGNPATGMDTALLPTLELVTNPTGTGPIPPGNYLLFTYRRTAISELALVVASCETDTDLIAPWTAAIHGASGVVIQEDLNYLLFTPAAPADTDRVRVYVPRGANTKLFGRLNVSVP